MQLGLDDALSPLGDPRALTREPGVAKLFARFVDGRLIYQRGRWGHQATVVEASRSGGASGAPNDSASLLLHRAGSPSLAGTTMAVVRESLVSAAWRVRLNADPRAVGEPQRLWTRDGISTVPAASPDASQIAYTKNLGGEGALWLHDGEGKLLRKLVALPSAANYPRWSPDGSTLSFEGAEAGSLGIYVVAANGGRPKRLSPENVARDVGAVWDPSGEWIYFTSFRSGSSQIWKMRPDGSEATQVTQGGV